MSELPLIPFDSMASILLPTTLDGSEGLNRAQTKSQINANTDFSAITHWLEEYKYSEATYRNYKKDAERLLLWSINIRQKPLSSLTGDDLLLYSRFLDAPPASWCAPKLARNGKRWSRNWRPFVGALSKNSKTAAFANLRSLFNYLVEANYLDRNPLTTVRRRVRQQSVSFIEQQLHLQERIIDVDEWLCIEETLDELPAATKEEKWEKIRVMYLFALYFYTAMRVSELVSHNMSNFKRTYDQASKKYRWWLFVVGKGQKMRPIPIAESFLPILISYRRYLGLSDLPQANESEPLIRALACSRPITSRRINQIIKAITEQAATYFAEKQQPEKAERLRRFSSHWMRHLSLSMQERAQVKKKHMKDNAGHATEQTTELYSHSFENERHEDVQKLSCGIKIKEEIASYAMDN